MTLTLGITTITCLALIVFDQALHSAAPRDACTKIINKSISKGDNGRPEISSANPYFEECRIKMERKWRGEKQKGVTFTLAAQQCGGEA